MIAPLVTAIREPQLGGSQALIADLATGFTSRGHQVDVYAATGSSIPGVTVVDTGVDPRSLVGSLYRADGTGPADVRPVGLAFATVYAAVRRIPYDIVHNHAFDPPAVREASLLRSPVIHTLHLPPDPHVAAALTESGRSDNPPTVAAVSVSQSAAWQILTAIDTVLPNGVPVARIPWSETAGEGVVFAGRFSPEKGAEDAIDIARYAGVPIDLYGEPYDVDYSRSLIESHRGQPGVAIHGGLARAELWRVMARSRAVLCPAKWDEPFGMVAAEAQAAGTPVICYRRGALPEIVVDHRTGFVVPRDDRMAAARALKEVESIQRDACRRHAEDHLNLDTTIAAHESLYERLLQRAGATRNA